MNVTVRFDFDCEDLSKVGTSGELRRLISDCLTEGAETTGYFIDNIELLKINPD